MSHSSLVPATGKHIKQKWHRRLQSPDFKRLDVFRKVCVVISFESKFPIRYVALNNLLFMSPGIPPVTKPVLLDDFYFLKTAKEQREKVISLSRGMKREMRRKA